MQTPVRPTKMQIAGCEHDHGPGAGVGAAEARACTHTFPPGGSQGPPQPTPPHALGTTFTFKEYYPSAFRELRARSAISQVRGCLGDPESQPTIRCWDCSLEAHQHVCLLLSLARVSLSSRRILRCPCAPSVSTAS
jgi:hypothetical protein